MGTGEQTEAHARVVRMKLLDTTFLIDLLRGKEPVRHVLSDNEHYFTTQINMYEVITGLFLGKKTEGIFEIREIFDIIRVLPLDDAAIIKAAEINARLLRQGEGIEDADCLVAGIALAHNVTTIITRNKKHFERIEGIQVESY